MNTFNLLEILLMQLEKGSKDSTAMLVATSSPSLDPTTSAYRLSTVLTAITTFKKDVDSLIAEHAVVNLLVLGHHPAIGESYSI